MKSRKSIRKPLIILTILCIVFFIVLFTETDKWKPNNVDADSNKVVEQEYYYNNEDEVTGGEDMDERPDTAKEFEKAPEALTTIPIDTDTHSVRVLVNRKYTLESDYEPEDLVVPDIRFSYYGVQEKSHLRAEAAMWIEKLFEAAKEEQINLVGVSGYRSYSRQKQIYDSNVVLKGEATTNKVSAKPGTSEHQTGLAMDVSAYSVGCQLEQTFGDTIEGKWLAKNSYKYGFIIRYGKGKDDITGYIYEPWHIRYVGKNLAKYLYKNDLTLEEYYDNTLLCDQVRADKGMKKAVKEYLLAKTQPQAPSQPTVAAPSAAPTPEPTQETVQTPEPTKEPKPTKTPKPEETLEPSATPPEETVEPVVTEEPIVPTEPETPAVEGLTDVTAAE